MTARSPALPPGPRSPLPITTLRWGVRPGPLMTAAQRRYGDVFTLRIASEAPWVMLADPDHVKQVFTGDPRLLHAGAANKILRPILGPKSVLLLDEGAHLEQRKLMLPPFHGERMQRYGDLMTAAAEREIDRWPRGTPFQVWPRMQQVTLEVIMRAVFGVNDADRLDRLRNALNEALDWTTSVARMIGMAVLGPERALTQRIFDRAMRPANEIVLDEITRRRADPDVAERDDILSLLIQARHSDGSPMSDDELRDELMTLLIAGHETTATGLAWALERLARDPASLERLRDEGDDAFRDAVVKETLRLRPVLPIVLRQLVEPMEIGGHLLPAGVSVAPCIYLVHRNPRVYPEPERFRPERFLEQTAGTYTWVPFGGGVRRCLGASFALFEMKAVLAAIVRRVDLRPASPESERISRRAITLTPSRGAELVAEPRARGGDERPRVVEQPAAA
jgi:cytochrome P450